MFILLLNLAFASNYNKAMITTLQVWSKSTASGKVIKGNVKGIYKRNINSNIRKMLSYSYPILQVVSEKQIIIYKKEF